MTTASTNALTISPATFLSVLSRYKSLTASPACIPTSKASAPTPDVISLQNLDVWRVETLPKLLDGSGADGSEGRSPPYLTSSELQDMLKCKMKRGKYRPTLLPLVKGNNPKTVETSTRTAFAFFKDTTSDGSPSKKAITDALNHLAKNLKGVGPATASYVLAAKSPYFVPAFSDEAFRWVFSESIAPGVKGKTGEGWKRKMDYSLKEYLAFHQRVQEISQRLIKEASSSKTLKLAKGEGKDRGDYRHLFGAGCVEMVGWVLGKEASGWAPGKVRGPEDGDEAAQSTGAKVGARRGGGAGGAGRKRKQDEDKDEDDEDDDEGEVGGDSHDVPGEKSPDKSNKATPSSKKAKLKMQAEDSPKKKDVKGTPRAEQTMNEGGVRRSGRAR